MPSPYIHDHAKQDLRDISVGGRKDVVAKFTVLLKQLQADPDLLNKLTTHGYDSGTYDVKKWWEFWRTGKDIWRLSHHEIYGYRMIYALERVSAFNAEPKIYVLAFAPRSFNYDAKHPLTIRILADYAKLGDC